jgi:hypothetical protein
MKKTIGLALLLLSIFNTTQAYIFKVGPRLGISASRIKLNEELTKCYDPEIGLGYQIGIFGRADFPIIHIQPELLFTDSKVKVKSKCPDQDNILQYKKIELPILFGMKILEIGRIQLGPIFSVLLSAKNGNKDIYADCKTITAGYQIGIGVDIQRFMIDLKYEGNLSKVCTKLMNVTVDHRESLFLLSVGINLL